MYECVDITFFCNSVLSKGDPVEFWIDQSQHQLVRKYRGGIFAGISMNSVVDIGCAEYFLRGDEVPRGSKIGIAVSGSQVILPIHGNIGEYIRPRKDGTWKIGCKRKNAVGRIVNTNSNHSIVRLM